MKKKKRKKQEINWKKAFDQLDPSMEADMRKFVAKYKLTTDHASVVEELTQGLSKRFRAN